MLVHSIYFSKHAQKPCPPIAMSLSHIQSSKKQETFKQVTVEIFERMLALKLAKLYVKVEIWQNVNAVYKNVAYLHQHNQNSYYQGFINSSNISLAFYFKILRNIHYCCPSLKPIQTWRLPEHVGIHITKFKMVRSSIDLC